MPDKLYKVKFRFGKAEMLEAAIEKETPKRIALIEWSELADYKRIVSLSKVGGDNPIQRSPEEAIRTYKIWIDERVSLYQGHIQDYKDSAIFAQENLILTNLSEV